MGGGGVLRPTPFYCRILDRRLKLSKTRSTKPLEALSQSNGPFCVRKLVYNKGREHNPPLCSRHLGQVV